MAKIIRKTQKIFADNANNSQITAFGTAKDAQPLYTRDIAQIQTNDFLSGWLSSLVTDLAPFLEDSNSLWYMITSQMAYVLQEGIAEYDNQTTYYKGSLVKYSDADGNITIYKSKQDNNLNKDPQANGNFWAVYLQDNNLAKYEIALPQATLSNNLLKNEIWLEGQIVSRTQYTNLFNIYGTTYGYGDGVSTFQLPDMRNRVLWGKTESDSFGYLSQTLPNITGSIRFSGIDPSTNKGSASGAFTKSNSSGAGNGHDYPKGSATVQFDFNANRVEPTYQDGASVRPNAIKVRWKTRWY